jgi:UDP-N-acetylbacillosamine N-acetyltransferase
MKYKTVIWGASGHASVVADILRLSDEYEVVGFLDDVNLDRTNTLFSGAPIFGGQDQLEILHDTGIEYIILAFGNCEARLKKSELVIDKGYKLATAIHPSATLANDVTIGDGTVIAAGAVINPGSQIGRNVIINTSASVDHDCIIDDGAHICPGVHLAGHVIVGRGTWIGIGSTVVERVRIGSAAYIGAGSVVLNDIEDSMIAYGVPAKSKNKVQFNLRKEE